MSLSGIVPIALVVLTCIHATRGQDVLPIEALRDLAQQRAGVVRSLRLTYEVYQDPDPTQPAAQIPHIVRHAQIDAEHGRYALDRTIVVFAGNDDDLVQVTTHFDFDGVAQGAYLPDQHIGLLKEGPDLHALVESGLWGVMLWSPPAPDGLGIDDGSLVSLLAHGRVRAELETVAGRRCHVVDAFHESVRYATVWLDVDRDLLPMRRVTYGHDGQPVSEVIVKSLVYLDDQGCWLPESWRTTLRLRGRTLTKHTVIHPESVEINPPVDPGDFSPRFPPGTVVTDQIAGLTYRVGPDGEPAEVLYEQDDSGQWYRVANGPLAREVPTRPEPQPDTGPLASEPRPDAAPLGSLEDLLLKARQAIDARRGPLPPRRTMSATMPAERSVRKPAATSVTRPQRDRKEPGRSRVWTTRPTQAPSRRAPSRLVYFARSPYLWAAIAVIFLAFLIGRDRGSR